MCHFLPVYHLGIAFLGWVEGQNITILYSEPYFFCFSARDRPTPMSGTQDGMSCLLPGYFLNLSLNLCAQIFCFIIFLTPTHFLPVLNSYDLFPLSPSLSRCNILFRNPQLTCCQRSIYNTTFVGYLMQKPLWYYLTHNWKDISSKVDVIEQLEFELTYNNITVQHISHNTMGTIPRRKWKGRKGREENEDKEVKKKMTFC